MVDRKSLESLVAYVLDGTELRLKLDEYDLHENLESGDVRVRARLHDQKSGEVHQLEGHGVGLVDAMFRALRDRFSDAFPSLKTLRFSEFSIKADIDAGVEASRADSNAEVTLVVINSEDRAWRFSDRSLSLSRSSLNVVLEAVAFFINSERAFIAVYKALEYAKESNRQDSINTYTQQLSSLVHATSYTEVIEQMRQSALGDQVPEAS